MQDPCPDAQVLAELFAAEHAVPALRAARKAVLLRDLAGRAASALGLDGEALLAALDRREALGSTGIGRGIALPHARLDAVSRPFGLLARCRPPVAFEALDDAPVDLVVLLVLPADPAHDPGNALACVSRRLRDPDVAQALRAARDAEALRAALLGR